MTGLSKHSHISDVLKLLKLFKIQELYHYMKLVFVKNLTNNITGKKIFEYLLECHYKNKQNTKKVS